MKLEEDFRLNVVPLIDVMLVLLVIVLCAASFIEYGKVDIKLPKSKDGSKEFPQERIEILLNSENMISINDKNVNLDALKAKLKDLSKDTFILFKGDERAQFGEFVVILQILKELELANFVIMTEVVK